MSVLIGGCLKGHHKKILVYGCLSQGVQDTRRNLLTNDIHGKLALVSPNWSILDMNKFYQNQEHVKLWPIIYQSSLMKSQENSFKCVGADSLDHNTMGIRYI